MKIQIETQFDKNTSTLTYIVYDADTNDAVVIDPVLDFDPPSGRVWLDSAQKVLDFVNSKKLNVHYILETHAHADHLSSAKHLKKSLRQAKIAIGEKISQVQATFEKIFNLKNFKADGSQFDLLLNDGKVVKAGSLSFKAISTPGHTPACMSYLIGENLFVGDSIFMPDSGTGRCDFPSGSAQTMYKSITEKIYTLPDSTKIFVGHDYQPNGRALQYQTTVGEEKKSNIHLTADTSLEKFVGFRTERDKTLSAPRLLLPSLQINISGGEFPAVEDNGVSYLKLPLKGPVFDTRTK
jgi:glyoxylase-like metal-dependent hydrolase (beta-lactamase superfamily II)